MDRLKTSSQSYKLLEKAKLDSKPMNDAHSTFKEETLKLEHTKEICTLQVEIEQYKLTLSLRDSDVEWLDSDISSLKLKEKKMMIFLLREFDH